MDRTVISIETAKPFCALGKEGGDILHADAGGLSGLFNALLRELHDGSPIKGGSVAALCRKGHFRKEGDERDQRCGPRLANAGKACASCLIAVHRFNALGNSRHLGKVVGDDVLRVREIVAQ